MSGPTEDPHGPSPETDEDRRLAEALRQFEELSGLPKELADAKLAQLASDDRELHRLVSRMLAADSDPRKLEIASLPAEDATLPDRRPGHLMGPYRLLKEIGRGGMGVVYLAERVDGAYEARVAIKVVGAHLAGSRLLEQFLVERNLLGRLEHPGIARILDAGTDDSGTPYFVMEHVDGTSLVRYCDENRLHPLQRLELFRKVCAAVAYAHRNLIVHRDLKPSNILIDRRGQPKLLDFGIAKLLEEGAESSAVTQLGQRALTPDYASPEQLEGRAVSTASDVFTLGVVLYELLTGCLPFAPAEEGRPPSRSAPRDPSRVLSEHQSATRRLADVAADRGMPSVAALARLVRGELEVTLFKALQEDPERRYGSAGEFSEDVRRYLEGLPVLAQPDSLAYRWRKSLVRHRAAALSALLIVLSLVTGLTVSIVQTQRAVAARERSERASLKTNRINRFLLSVFQAADPSWYVDAEAKGPDTRIIDVLGEASARIGSELEDDPLEKADLLTTLGNTYRALRMLELAEVHLQQALEIRLQNQGEVHPDTVETLYFLAASIRDHRRAIAIWERAVVAERQLAEPSGNGPYLLADSANVQIFLGNLDSAERRLREARARLANEVDPPANQIATIELELELHRGHLAPALEVELHRGDRRATPKARALVVLGRYEEALRVLEQIPGENRGVWNPVVAIRAETLLGRFEEAEARLNRERALGDPWLFGSLDLLLAEAHLRRATGRFEECAALAARVRTRWLEYTDSISPLFASDLDWAEGECHLRAGRPGAGLPLLRAASSGFADLFDRETAYQNMVAGALAEALDLESRP